MQKILILLTVLVLSLPSLADAPSAMITNLDGAALVVTKTSKVSAAPMMALDSNTLIDLRGGTKMTVVFFAEGTSEQYVGPALIGIGQHRGKVFHGEESARKLLPGTSALVKAIDPNALGESPGAGPLTVSQATGKSVLTWTTDLAGPYLVTVLKPAQNKTARANVWSEELAAKTLTYSGPALDPQFTYIVEVKAGDQMIGTRQFRILNGKVKPLTAAQAEADKLTAADPTDTTPQVLMSTLYNQNGMTKEAGDALRPAIGARPSETAFIDRMNAMGQQVNKVANSDTVYAQGFYAAEDNWGTDTYYDPEAWGWNGGWDI